MEMGTLMAAAIQSSFLLGLLHGVNPCGHSWLVLAPFVSGEKKGRRVFVLTVAFLAGTALACLVLGATLGAVSQLLPESMGVWVEGGTSVILIGIGLLLIYNPHLLHSHDHDHDHGHGHGHDHGHHHHDHDHHHHGESHAHHSDDCNACQGQQGRWARFRKISGNSRFLPLVLFVIGFVNMIVPCPTAAVMYGYALNSGSAAAATIVFGTYAVSTAIAVGGVIYIIFKATTMAGKLQKDWVEPLIMRLAGLVIVVFSGYSLYGMYV